jgi:hypothetical protein
LISVALTFLGPLMTTKMRSIALKALSSRPTPMSRRPGASVAVSSVDATGSFVSVDRYRTGRPKLKPWVSGRVAVKSSLSPAPRQIFTTLSWMRARSGGASQ